jgi:cytochrome c
VTKQAAVLLAALCALAACGRGQREIASSHTGGDPQRGRTAIRAYGCHSCHTIPGVRGADAVVGPSLDRVAVRQFVGGQPNTPENLMRWIRDPRSVHPHTPMPALGVTEGDARDIAAYLYTLR